MPKIQKYHSLKRSNFSGPTGSSLDLPMSVTMPQSNSINLWTRIEQESSSSETGFSSITSAAFFKLELLSRQDALPSRSKVLIRKGFCFYWILIKHWSINKVWYRYEAVTGLAAAGSQQQTRGCKLAAPTRTGRAGCTTFLMTISKRVFGRAAESR